ncbi:MAG: PDZ domain-containing protein [Lachnospira eligens]
MYCGITGQNVTEELAAKYGLPSGVYISNVDIDSPAYYAGLQAGDVISAINGQSVLQFSSLVRNYISALMGRLCM